MLKFLIFIYIFYVLSAPLVLSAESPVLIDSPAFILVEQTTGRVLYARNERERRPPAGLSKMMTAIIAAEHLSLYEEIIIGQEIRGMPAGFATNAHSEGDIVSVESLLHTLIIRSGNETGRILALNTMRRVHGRVNIPIEQAEREFAELMNERARELGARQTRFDNSFGATSDNHFTTAYDMALITRAFMENPTLAEIAATLEYENRTNPNQMLPHAPHGYAHMIGAKAAHTTQAGHVLAGAAYWGGMQFVTVVLGGTDAMRWQDTRRLMDYAFLNYSFREITREGEPLVTMGIENPQLGDCGTLEIISSQSHTALLSHAEYASLERQITFDPLFYVYENSTLLAPIESGGQVATATYTVNGEPIFTTPLIAATAVYERTFDSDLAYYLDLFLSNIFTRTAAPYWFGAIGTIIGIIGIILAITADRRAENRRTSRYTKYR